MRGAWITSSTANLAANSSSGQSSVHQLERGIRQEHSDEAVRRLGSTDHKDTAIVVHARPFWQLVVSSRRC